jgi:hypothetical protein
MPAPGPVPLGFRLHHLSAGTRFRLGRLRCLAYGGAFPVWSPGASRDWHRAAARERAALKRLAGGGEIDLLFCHDPRTLEQGAQARGSFAALAAELRPALVIYAHQHRPHVSAAGEPALIGLGSFREGHSSAVVLDSAETRRLGASLRSARAPPIGLARRQRTGPSCRTSSGLKSSNRVQEELMINRAREPSHGPLIRRQPLKPVSPTIILP